MGVDVMREMDRPRSICGGQNGRTCGSVGELAKDMMRPRAFRRRSWGTFTIVS